jgi:hypothetical protein
VNSKLIVFSLMVGLLRWNTLALSDDTNFKGVTILSSKAKIQEGNCYSYEATAVIEAPPRLVYDALANPQNVLAPQRTIESPDHRSQILEYDHIGGMDPPPGHHVVYRVQYLFDSEHLTVSTRVLNNETRPFNAQFALSPLKNGSATLVYHRSWDCERQRLGDNPRNEEDLARGLSVGLQFQLQNIERGIRYTGGPAVPQFRGGQRVYPTAIATPAPSQQ